MRRKKENNKSKKILVNIALLTFIIVAAISGINIFKWLKENKESQDILEQISTKVTVVEEVNDNIQKKYNVDFNALKHINTDTVSWIKVEGTDIEYPVVKAKDNDYYLNKSFNKTYNSAGWVFMDYRNTANGTDKNIVIYGHNRKDGSMFGTLKDIFEEAWYSNEQNKYITYVTESENCIYEIFSAYRIIAEDYYITTNFKSDEEFEQFVNTIKARSFRNFGTEVNSSDQILTLSTCSNGDYRVAVHAKKVERNGE